MNIEKETVIDNVEGEKPTAPEAPPSYMYMEPSAPPLPEKSIEYPNILQDQVVEIDNSAPLTKKCPQCNHEKLQYRDVVSTEQHLWAVLLLVSR